jgi:ACS family sodium-dependent inorganic phosphate cotransporter-like MFS transporter 5
VCLLALTDCSRPVFALIILSLAVAFQGFCFSGCFVNYMEVAPRYAGTIFAIGNSLGSITGFVAPFLVGWITSNHTHAEWSVAFFVCAGVMAVGALVYLIFARADVQPWAREQLDEEPAPPEAGVSYKAKGNEADADAEAKVRLTANPNA